MNLDLYLERISFTGPCPPTLETLNGLHRAHLESVPFENLDIALGREIRLDRAAFFEKVVTQRRGGFCYELNGLFGWLLDQLGYQVTLLSASDSKWDGSWGPEFDHLTLQVGLSGQSGAWLADVGWGDTFREPLQLDLPGEQHRSGRTYWFEAAGEFTLLYQKEADGTQERQYRFTRQPRRLEDFAGMCRYHQSSPDSPFTRQRLVTRATPHGRLTISGQRLIETTGSLRSERELSGEDEVQQILSERFGIQITP